MGALFGITFRAQAGSGKLVAVKVGGGGGGRSELLYLVAVGGVATGQLAKVLALGPSGLSGQQWT